MILCLCPNPAIDKYIWVHNITPGKANRITCQQSFPGGKGVHVALGIAELGEECALLGFWGGDTGKYIKEFCEKKGVSCYGPVIDEPNRTCFTFRSPEELDSTELLEPGPFINEAKGKLFWQEYIRLLDIASIVCMSGSWPPAKEEMNYAEFVVAANKKRVLSFVDCSGKSLINTLSANPHCVHINNPEGFDIFREHSPIKIADAVLKNCDLAAITCGADGLYLVDKNQGCIHAVCKLDNIISAVGSGDSLMAGLIVAKKKNLNLSETAKLAAACGAANCIRDELGQFYKRDVRKLVTTAELHSVDYTFSF